MKYRVMMRCVEYFYLDVEADSFEEAEEIAYDTDGEEFTDAQNCSWNTYSIEDETGKKEYYA